MSTDLIARHFFAAAEQASRPTVAPRVSLGDEVYESLLSQLITLKISPGSRIAVDALVREMGVSQTPIRAALIRLENEGLVVKTHNVGYSAAPMPSRQKFEQIYDLRLLLEPYTAAQAARKVTDKSRAEMEALAASMVEPLSRDAKRAYSKFAVQDAKFHAFIARESGNELVAEALARAFAHTHLFRLRFHSQITEEAIKEHALIVTAIANGDAAQASQAMENHIICSRERMQPFFETLD